MRQQHRDVLTPMINEAFKTRTYAEWEVRLREENLMYGPILSPEQVIEDPQALANDFFEEVDQPGVGTFRTINSPNKFVQNPASIKSTDAGARRADGRDPRRARLRHERHRPSCARPRSSSDRRPRS